MIMIMIMIKSFRLYDIDHGTACSDYFGFVIFHVG